MAGERPSAEDFSKELRRELEETPGEIEAAPKPEVLEMEEMPKEEIEDIHEQREQVEKTREAMAELFAAMVSESESPEEIKRIMSRVDAMSSLAQAETLEVLPEKPFEAVEALGDEHKGVNSSYILRLAEKRISLQEGTEEITIKQAIYKPKAGAANGIEYLKEIWDRPEGKLYLSEIFGVKLEGGKKLEDFFPGADKTSLRPGIEKDSLHLREWLASMIDEAIGTDVVPATVLRMEKGGVGSVQEFVPDAKTPCEDTSREIDDDEMRKMAAFDFVAGSLDKHDSNYLAGKKLAGSEKRKAHSIDNGYILSTGFESYLGELDIVSKPLEQFNPNKAEGGRVIDSTLSAPFEKSLGKFLKSEKLQGALRKCFGIALGSKAETAWQGFIARVGKLHSEKRLPTEHDRDSSSKKLGYVVQHELLSLGARVQQEQAQTEQAA